MSSVGYHEPVEELSDETRDMHRAIVSLIEELEAVDWYNQRADACRDPELKAILAHNRDEEKEHAAMAIEWLRRHDPVFDRHLRTYLFTTGNIVAIETEAEHSSSSDVSADEPMSGTDGSLPIGDLRGATS